MATTPTELRSLLIQLSDNAELDLAQLWAQLDRPQDVGAALADVAPALIGDYGDAAAVLTAEWYDEHRADLNVRGSFSAPVAATQELGVDAFVGWGASLAQQNWDTALARLSGGLTLRVFNASRDTLTTATVRDPQARGWQRSGHGECAFCKMLIGRGSVFTKATADFAAHDNCRCVAVPVFGGRPVPVKPYAVSDRDISDADRARVRAWIAANL